MEEIISRCKYGVFFTANEHKNYYEAPEKWLIDQMQDSSDVDTIDKDVWVEMVKRDNILRLQFYPDTPNGFYVIYHYDYDCLIKMGKDILNGQG